MTGYDENMQKRPNDATRRLALNEDKQRKKNMLRVAVECQNCHKRQPVLCTKEELHVGLCTIDCDCGDTQPKIIVGVLEE